MVSTTRKILKSSKRLDKTKGEVLALEERKNELLKEIEYKETKDYIEEVARDELNLIKPGEDIYIYPKEEKSNALTGVRKEIQDFWTPPKDEKPIKEWLDLVF